MSAPLVAGVVLAAGLGTRLAPLTTLRPKALCPVGDRTLLDLALDRLAGLGLIGGADVAVNAHHHAATVVAAVAERAQVSVEQPAPLGSAGALGALRGWLDGRGCVVANADAYLDDPTDEMLDGWDGERVRLLVVHDPGRGDFGPWRFAGCSVLPWDLVAALQPRLSGLYEAVWRPALEAGRAELVPFAGTFIDCGTPADYLAANLHVSGGRSVVGAGARVEGRLERSVVWPGAHVGAAESLVDAIRAGHLTVDGTPPAGHTDARRPAEGAGAAGVGSYVVRRATPRA